MPESLPSHLRKYITQQNQEQYTPVDHSVWRYILRQLRSFLKVHAHESYLEGLEKTGITTDRIPRIEDISRKIEKFGWRALPVSGFIPPAAFMELQSLSVLPIAADMRTLEHLLYTPAPDIVHEAAGHAPILVQPEFAAYLKRYAQVARKALISHEDLEVYNAIRDLSDTKESPQSTPADIERAEQRLHQANKNVTHLSEASLLGRMNWWTAEYGLIGELENPKIFGAGLLSSVGEAKWCLSEKVKRIPLSIDCLNYSYDITEPQPQLFVAKDFQHLSDVLDEMSRTMAFKTGGPEGVKKAIQAQTVNTIELDSGIQIGGECREMILDDRGHLAYLIFKGPTQLAYSDHELPGHGKDYHREGFGTPLGRLRLFPNKMTSELLDEEWAQTLHQANDKNLNRSQLHLGDRISLDFESDLKIQGEFAGFVEKDSKKIILTLKNSHASYHSRILFQPEWGNFDLALGDRVTSVYSGPPDRKNYGEQDDFVVAQVPRPLYSEKDQERHRGHQILHFARAGSFDKSVALRDQSAFLVFCNAHLLAFPDDWLFALDSYEFALQQKWSSAAENLKKILDHLRAFNPKNQSLIDDGLELVNKKGE